MLTIALGINLNAQKTVYLMPNAANGNWYELIWKIDDTENTTFTAGGDISLMFYTYNLHFDNSTQPTMHTDLNSSNTLKLSQFYVYPASTKPRTFIGDNKILIQNLINYSSQTQTFDVPIAVEGQFMTNAQIIFDKEVDNELNSVVLSAIDDNASYIFNNTTTIEKDFTISAPATFNGIFNAGANTLIKSNTQFKNATTLKTSTINSETEFNGALTTSGDMTINAPSTFNNTNSTATIGGKLTVNSPSVFYGPIIISGLEVNKEGKGTTFKAPVTVMGDAIGHGVTSYESSLTIQKNLTIEDTTGIQMPTSVGGHCYINAPFYIVDSLKVSGDWYVTAPIHIMQSIDHSRQGYLEVNKEDHKFPELNIYNGGKATIRNGRIEILNFMDGSTNLTMSNENITNLSYVRSAYDERKLPVSGTGVNVTNSTITMQFPSSDYYYMIGFPFDVTFVNDPNDMLVFEYDGNIRGNGVTGWKKFTGSTLTAGKGYAFASNVPVIFRAKNGTNEYSKITGSSTLEYYTGSSPLTENYGWNSITTPFANPQPLQLNEGMFVYRYEPESDKYDTYSPGESFTARPFEGFFIKTVEGQENAQFSQPEDNSPVRVRRSMPNAINMELISNGYTYPTRIKFDERATTGYDELYDAPFTAGMSPNATQFFSFCNGGNGQYAINSLPEETDNIRLGYKIMNSNGGNSYTITWNNEAGMDLELYDTEMQIATDMVSLNSYSFMVANDGINMERFVIRKKNASGPTTSIEEVSANKNILIQEGAIIINTENSAHISIYDIMGHVIAEGDNKGQQQYNIGQPGIYIVKINGEATKVLVK